MNNFSLRNLIKLEKARVLHASLWTGERMAKYDKIYLDLLEY